MMRSVSRLVSVLLFAVCTTTLSAKPYIVVLSGKSPVTAATVGAAGGSVVERFADHLVVDLPPDGAELLRHDPGVKYLELIGEAEPRSAEPPASSPSRARIEAWTPPTWSSGTYNYDGAGNIYAIGTADSPASDGTRNTYTYDVNSRLATWTGPGSWSESYTYDLYGNMTAKTMGASTMNMPVTTASNHLTAESYDTAGNRTSSSTSPSHAYAYDSVNMMVKDQEGTSAANWYVYTADDERIGVLNGDNWTWSLRGSDHEVLRQFRSVNSAPSSAWTWVEDYVYRGGLLLASERVPEEGGRRQFHLDHLGTPRMITSPSGALIALHDLTPFGSDMSQCNQETGVGFDREEPRRFTGHERDFAADGCDPTVLDYMHARGYSVSTARFASLDSHTGTSTAPQSWNRYGYGEGNPIKYIDTDGRDVTLFIRDNSGGGGLTNFGHTAIRVHGKGYDITFDFGRYRQTHLLIFGEGMLRIWTNWEAFLRKQSTHGASKTVLWQTPRSYDSAVIAFFEALTAKGQQTNKTDDYTEYKLSRDYSVFGTNCSSICGDALSAAESETGFALDGFDQFFSRRLSSPLMTWSAATEYDLAYGPDGLKRIESMDALFDIFYSSFGMKK
jgi:RHS repeat-associated protein